MDATKSLTEGVRAAGAAMRSMNRDIRSTNVADALKDFAKQANLLDAFQEEMDVRCG